MIDDNTIIHSTLEEGYDFFITDKWNKNSAVQNVFNRI